MGGNSEGVGVTVGDCVVILVGNTEDRTWMFICCIVVYSERELPPKVMDMFAIPVKFGAVHTPKDL
jgi:hypothetical protein